MSTITVTSDAASGAGSLANAVATAQNGDTIAFASDLTGATGNTIDLAATLVIAKNITIQGGGGVTLDGGNAVTVMQVNAGETLNLSGVTIADGSGTGAAGATGATGSNSAGGILDQGKLTVSNTTFNNDNATGGTGGAGAQYKGGGTGGKAAGAIYVAASGSLAFGQGVLFNSDIGTGGTGGAGGSGAGPYGVASAGGQGGAAGQSGSAGKGYYDNGNYAGAGGKAGQAGGAGKTYSYRGHSAHGAGGGGGGGSAFANYGGAGTIGTLPVSTVVTTNASSGQGSLAAILAAAPAGSTITFAAGLDGTTIDLAGALTISKNVTIEGGGEITLDGKGIRSIAAVNAGVTATLDGLILENGDGNLSGAITNAGNLTITNSTVTGSGSGTGAAIVNTGTLTANNAIFSNNYGVYGGAIDNQGQLTVTNSTFTGNSADNPVGSAAGAIYMGLGSTTAYPTSDAFSNNTGTAGSGGTGYRNFGGLGKVTGAPIITVTSDAASGAGSLAAAVQEAINGQEIVFASNLTGKTGNIIDLSSTLVIAAGVTIDGGGDITLDGGNKHTVVEVDTLSTVTLTGLTIADGSSTASGGQYSATAGGILDLGSVNVTNTVFSNDTGTGLNGKNGASGASTGGGGGGQAGSSAAGGIFVGFGDNATIGTGVAFSGDSAQAGTGGNGGSTFLGATFSAAGGKGGAVGQSGTPGKPLFPGTLPAQGGTPGMNGHTSPDSGGGGGGGGIQGNDYAGFGTIDATVATVVTVTSDAASGAGSLTAALQDALDGQKIVFASKLTGKTGNTIDLSSTLVINGDITIDGGGDITLDGGGKNTVLEISAPANVTLTGLTIADGASTAAGGQGSGTAGGVLDLGSLTVSATTFSNNTATGLNGANGADGSGNGVGGGGGQAGGSAAGGIFVGSSGSLAVGGGVTFTGDSGIGGTGGNGGSASAGSFHGVGGEGGAPGQSGEKGSAPSSDAPAAGGAPGMNGGTRQDSSGGGGGGGLQDANFTGYGAISVPVIVVTSDAASGEGSLSQALLDAQNGTKIEFAAKLKGSTGNTIDLPSTLILSKNVTIEGIGSGGAGITLNAQGKGTAVQVDKGVTAVIDGVTIADGKGTSTSTAVVAVGGIIDDGNLTVTNTIFKNDTAKGAAGANGNNISTAGFGTAPQGGQAGGSAAGGIFVENGAILSVSSNDVFTGVSATGGNGGNGGTGLLAKYPAGKGGTSGKAGGNGQGAGAGKGGAPGHNGTAAINLNSGASAGGGGGGIAYTNYGGPGTVKQVKTTDARANTTGADTAGSESESNSTFGGPNRSPLLLASARVHRAGNHAHPDGRLAGGVALFNQFVAAEPGHAGGRAESTAIVRHLADATTPELAPHHG